MRVRPTPRRPAAAAAGRQRRRGGREKCVYTDGKLPGESSGRGSQPALCLRAPTSCSEKEKAQDPISVQHNRVDSSSTSKHGKTRKVTSDAVKLRAVTGPSTRSQVKSIKPTPLTGVGLFLLSDG